MGKPTGALDMPREIALCRPDIAEEFGIRIADPGPRRPMTAIAYIREDLACDARDQGLHMGLSAALRVAAEVASTDANMSKAWRDGAAEVVRRLHDLAAEMGVPHEAG